MTMNIGSLQKIIIPLMFSIFMVSIPWELLQGYKFVDLNNYRAYFLYETPVYEYVDFSRFIDFITREALWHYFGFFLIRKLGIHPDYVFYSISFFCFFVFSFIVQKFSKSIYIFLLINPLIVALCMSQLRSAFAISFLFLAYIVNIKLLKFAIVVISLFLHTSVVMFVLVFLTVKIFLLKFANNKKLYYLILYFMLGLMISIFIGPLRELILGWLGDRRAVYIDASSSILYTSFWIVFLLVMMLQRKEFFNNEIHSFVFIIVSTVSVNVFTGGYSTRFLALFFPFIIASIYQLDTLSKILTLTLFFVYSCSQWFYWLKLNVAI